MPTDLELIEQLKEEIGEKLEDEEPMKLEDVVEGAKNGYVKDKDGNVIGLNLDLKELIPLPASLLKLHHLTRLSLFNTQLIDISFLQDMKQIDHLDLRKNKITDISSIKGLDNLIRLDLSENQITDISSLQGLKNLEKLDLRNNKITDISPLQGLKNLTYLDLSENQITDISSLQGLKNLIHLDLNDNQITDISFLQGLKNLTRIDLRNNKIKELPESFLLELEMEINVDSGSTDKNLQGIFLDGNPIETPPLEILIQGKEKVKSYLNSLRTGENTPINEVKVLLVGGAGTGKTSLCKRLQKKSFDEKEPQTHGINIKSWTVNIGDRNIETHFWDFGGQEIMHATHHFFLSKRSLYILLLDGRKDEKPDYWLKHIRSFGGDSPVLVVINKIDENPGFDVNRKFLKEKYTNIKGFRRISCKTKKGINNFISALKKALAQIKILNTKWPANWFYVKARLEYMTENFISYKEYQEICATQKITEKSSQDILLNFLNDLGVVLHFKDLELEDTHVLNPQWVSKAVYKIINSEILAASKGVLKLRLLEEILKQNKPEDYYYPTDKHRYIIELMKKFGLCYELEGQQVLVPDLLKVDQPNFVFDYNSALKLVIQYDFLPRSIMPRFIVNMQKDIKADLRWRTGVVIEDKDFDSTAVIKSDNEAKRIYIHVNGGQKRDYFAAILKTLRRINQSFEKLKTKELIPMPDDTDITVNYKHLIRLEQEGLEYYLPGESDKKYKVKDLLGSYGDVIVDDTMRILKEIKMSQLQEESKEEDSP
jgi:hypothetical protein